MAAEWSDQFKYGTKDQLNAIGALIAAWNEVELNMFCLYRELLNLSTDSASKLFDEHTNVSRFKLIRILVENRGDVELTNLISTFILHAGICSDNRNFVAHCYTQNLSDSDLMVRKIRTKDQIWTKYEIPLKHIRQAVVETKNTAHYCSDVMIFGMAQPVRGKTSRVIIPSDPSQAVHLSLPETPALPISLTQPPKSARV